jgi:hypothetical protein
MSQGFLLFAHDNEKINYGALAVWCAKRIHRWLDRPVSLVADAVTIRKIRASGLDLDVFDRVLTNSSETTQVKRYKDELLTFHNLDRSNAYDLSPYDETIIIDTDIIVQSTSLNRLWNSNHDMVFCRHTRSVFGHSHPDLEYVSTYGIDFFWATEFYFRKGEEAKVFFETCKWIRDNYGWFARVYAFDPNLMRNDFVWSIAVHQLGGKDHSNWAAQMPWPLFFTTNWGYVEELSDDSVVLSHWIDTAKDTFDVCRVNSKDVHVMNKQSLQTFVLKELGLTND